MWNVHFLEIWFSACACQSFYINYKNVKFVSLVFYTFTFYICSIVENYCTTSQGWREKRNGVSEKLAHFTSNVYVAFTEPYSWGNA